MAIIGFNDNVFINCPFDSAYTNMKQAIIFAVFDCNFRARCALEEDDGGEGRMEKIIKIISQCKYGIHDISRTEIDPKTNLPRFNMPFELGIFIGAKRLGTKDHKKKKCLIMDSERYRYRKFLSDIAGHDIKKHNNNPEHGIKIVTDWLRTSSERVSIPGGTAIFEHYNEFIEDYPDICRAAEITADEVKFNDYTTFVSEWIRQKRKVH